MTPATLEIEASDGVEGGRGSTSIIQSFSQALSWALSRWTSEEDVEDVHVCRWVYVRAITFGLVGWTSATGGYEKGSPLERTIKGKGGYAILSFPLHYPPPSPPSEYRESGLASP